MSFDLFNNAAAQNNNNTGSLPTTEQEKGHNLPTRRGAPNFHHITASCEKRRPHGGAKSHKVLDQPSFRNLFVARLPKVVNNDDLLALFAEFFPSSAVVMMDMVSGKSKGFGFVTFESEEAGRAACEAMSSRTLSIPHTAATNMLVNVPETMEYTLEMKPSTFNGQRIVVESRFVYFRNFPAELFVPATTQPQGSSICFEKVHAFLTHHGGSVLGIEFHGAGGADAPLLVSFATQAEAQRAIANCHGQNLFPQLSDVPIMAKYADMTTVKAMDKKNRRTLSSNDMIGPRSISVPTNPSIPSSGNVSPKVGMVSTLNASGSNGPAELLPFPTLSNRAPVHGVSVYRGGQTAPSTFPPHTPHHRQYSRGSFASTGSSNSWSTPGLQTPHGRSPTQVEEFLSPSHVTQHSISSNASSGRGRQRSHSRRASSGSYRNDPYNREGYVVMSSSSSQSSRLSTRSGSSDTVENFVAQQPQRY